MSQFGFKVGGERKRGRLPRPFGWVRAKLRRGGAEGGRQTKSSRLSLRDLFDEALSGISARPARLILTTVGTVLGIAALVATMAVGQTAAGQIQGRFDAAAATRIVVKPGEQNGPDGQTQAAGKLPWDAPERAKRLNGVAASGTVSEVNLDGELTRSLPFVDPKSDDKQDVPMLASSGGTFGAVHAKLQGGRFFDEGHDKRGDPVALLGKYAAKQLGITRVDNQPTIFVGDQPFAVIGIIDSVSGRTDLLDSIIVPNGTAKKLYGLETPTSLEIRTAIGAAQLIARQAAIAVDPNKPASLDVDAPPKPGQVRDDVKADVNALFLVLGAVALVVGGLGIANVTLLSVLERVGEIGLRRAIGAARRHIAAQFLVESVLMGLLGGLIGTAAGVLVTVTVSAFRDWTPLLDPRLAIAAPLLGAAIGLLAGTYPAWKASATEPIAALRAGV